MNKEDQNLKSFYESHQKEIEELSALSKKNCEWPRPFLIRVPDKYDRQSKSLLLVGQQTHGWAENRESNDISELLMEYHKFYSNPKKSSPFWKFVEKLEGELGFSSHQIVWSNLYKVDFNKEVPVLPKYGQDGNRVGKISLYFLNQEIDYCKPTIIIFACGKKEVYKQQMKKLGLNMPSKDLSPDEPCIKFEDKFKGATVFWCYHPKYLRMQKLFQTVLDKINASLNNLNSN